MKKIVYVTILAICFVACKSEKKVENTTEKEDKEYASFGEKIDDKNTLTASEMMKKYQSLQEGDSISVKFSSSINDVCSKKGCWMKLKLEDNQETMVRFKDYGFFMPLDSNNKDVIVEGKAFVKTVSVQDLKHYAEDAGKSKEEIDAIKEPKKEFAFEAIGVLMKK